MDLSPAGSGRMIVALVVIGLLALSAWSTMDAGLCCWDWPGFAWCWIGCVGGRFQGRMVEAVWLA